MSTPLEAAMTGDPELALEALLAAWRIARSPALSEAIELVAIRIDGARPRVAPGKSVEDRLAAWRSLEHAKRASDVGELMRSLLDVPGHALWDRLACLLERACDPRIAVAAIPILEQTFVAKGATWHHFREMSAILVRHGDARVLARVVDKAGPPVRNAAISRKTFWNKTAHELRAVLAALPAVDDPERDARVVELARGAVPQPAPAGDGPSLLRAIYDDPAADDAREVYADWLLGRGDLRGEFITLQLARARGTTSVAAKKRENELLRMYLTDWLGAIAPVVLKDGRAFERGFLHTARITTKSWAAGRAALDALEWATVVDLDVTTWRGPIELYTNNAMKGLRVLRGINPHAMASDPITTERVALLRAPWFAGYGLAAMIMHAPKCIWRGVKHLDVPATELRPGSLDDFWPTPFACGLASITFEVLTNAATLAPQLAELMEKATVSVVRVARSLEQVSDWRFELAREPTGRFRVKVEATGESPDAVSIQMLVTTLEQLTQNRVHSFTLGGAFDPELREIIEAAIDVLELPVTFEPN